MNKRRKLPQKVHAGTRRGAPAELSITAIRSILLQAPVSKQEYLLLEVETDGGITGTGDATLPGKLKAVQEALGRLQPLLIGKDPVAGAHLWHTLGAENNVFQAAFWAALGGVDMALWDIRGKMLGVPVYKLNGGPTRTKARVFTSIVGTTTAQLVEDAQLKWEKGVRVFLFTPPAPSSPDANPQFIRDIRRALEKLCKALPEGASS